MAALRDEVLAVATTPESEIALAHALGTGEIRESSTAADGATSAGTVPGSGGVL